MEIVSNWNLLLNCAKSITDLFILLEEVSIKLIIKKLLLKLVNCLWHTNRRESANTYIFKGTSLMVFSKNVDILLMISSTSLEKKILIFLVSCKSKGRTLGAFATESNCINLLWTFSLMVRSVHLLFYNKTFNRETQTNCLLVFFYILWNNAACRRITNLVLLNW